MPFVTVEAKNLDDGDIFGDPYVELWLDENDKKKTATKKVDVDKQKTLTVRVLDKDLIKDDKLGEAKVNLHDAITKGYSDTWVKLGQKKGEIHLILEFAY
ncbi:4296_t:CDS:2 [Entrophospora sp. SA101]|nr:4296_t:CDS:2 [Entrophospora sp. SA101]CAJ0830718.1 9640_t:CDS:2 [Entrophospora sp. SA101]